jgi:hypothetical protein
MVHNHGASGSTETRVCSLTLEEATVLAENNILVPPDYRLSHSWIISASGYAVPPIPEGAVLQPYIKCRFNAMPPMQQADPN